MKPAGWSLAFLIFISARPQEPSATIGEITLEKGRWQNELGIDFKINFTVTGCLGRSCLAQIYFYDKDKQPLRDKNGEYATESGKVAVWSSFKPGFETASYKDFKLFIPYNEFHLKAGTHDLWYVVYIYIRDENDKYQTLARTPLRGMTFSWKIEESGDITSARCEQDVHWEGAKGIEFTVNASIHGMAGKDGSIEIHFYHDYYCARPVFRGGSSDEGTLKLKLDIKPKYEDTDYENKKFFVPYRDFPLKIGKNIFYFKVWLLVVGSEKERYALDATNARAIYIRNGSLTLEEVWVIERIEILLDWPEPENGENLRLIEACLTEFNNRLYDATDGQIRVAAFHITRARGEHDHDVAALRFYKDFKSGDHGKVTERTKVFIDEHRSFANFGTPDRPRDAHLSLTLLKDRGARLYAGSVCHEFFHAWFSLKDEYSEAVDKETNKKMFHCLCAKDEALRSAYNCCIMGTSAPWNRELCNPETHNTEDESGTLRKTDCYTLVQQTLQKSLGKKLVVPEMVVAGPDSAPQPRFVIELE